MDYAAELGALVGFPPPWLSAIEPLLGAALVSLRSRDFDRELSQDRLYAHAHVPTASIFSAPEWSVLLRQEGGLPGFSAVALGPPPPAPPAPPSPGAAAHGAAAPAPVPAHPPASCALVHELRARFDAFVAGLGPRHVVMRRAARIVKALAQHVGDGGWNMNGGQEDLWGAIMALRTGSPPTLRPAPDRVGKHTLADFREAREILGDDGATVYRMLAVEVLLPAGNAIWGRAGAAGGAPDVLGGAVEIAILPHVRAWLIAAFLSIRRARADADALLEGAVAQLLGLDPVRGGSTEPKAKA